jgi:tetratricopeptide (TPR) repeat protein
MSDLNGIRDKFFDFVRRRDFDGAAAFLAEKFQKAKGFDDIEAATEIGDLYGGALMAGGHDDEALVVYRELVDSSPRNSYLRLKVATFLTTLLQRPSEALETLAPVLGDLLDNEAARHATIGIWGRNQAMIGNVEEARTFFKLQLEEDLSKMDARAIDFLLVEALLSRGEMIEEAQRYLSSALDQARRSGEDDVARRATLLLGVSEQQG